MREMMKGRSLSYDESYLHSQSNRSSSQPASSSQSGSLTDYSSYSPDRHWAPTSVDDHSPPFLYRTNFGKNMGYVPPASAPWNAPPTSNYRAHQVSPEDSDSVPFDQLRDSHGEVVGGGHGATVNGGRQARAGMMTLTATRSRHMTDNPRRSPTTSLGSDRAVVGGPAMHGSAGHSNPRYPTQQMLRRNSDKSRPFDEPDDDYVMPAMRAAPPRSSADSHRAPATTTTPLSSQRAMGMKVLRTMPRDHHSHHGVTTPTKAAASGGSHALHSSPQIFRPEVGQERAQHLDEDHSPSHQPRTRSGRRQDYDYLGAPSAEDLSRFRMTPPRISIPTVKPYWRTDMEEDDDDFSQSERGSFHDQPLNTSMDAQVGTPNRGRGAFEEFSRITDGSSAVAAAYRTGEKPKADDDDSIFDFDDGRHPSGKKSLSPPKVRTEEDEEDEDDSTSDLHYGAVAPSTSLQERSQAAWKRKAAAKQNPTTRSPGVSFGKDDTVQYFKPDADETTYTYESRSLNSLYTKSAESEFEDMVKDIFLIGSGAASNPGRRKLKYNPEIKQRLRQAEEDLQGEAQDTTQDDDDPSSLETESREPRDAEATSQLESIVDEKKEEDPLVDMWNFMEGGLQAVTSALGLEDSPNKRALAVRLDTCNGGQTESVAALESEYTEKDKKPEGTTISKNFWEYAAQVLLGSGEKNEEEKIQRTEEVPVLKSGPSLEEDLRLVDLATQAARSVHMLHGVEFDESYDIDIVKDMKFSVVDLRLPLGLIFQENDAGCWVTKVLPDGNAIKTGSVRVGDQLAAIDGASAINMKVDEIAKLIRSKPDEIELTFLRYVGPIRSADNHIEEQGYEISAAPKAEPPKSPKKLTRRVAGRIWRTESNQSSKSQGASTQISGVGSAAAVVSPKISSPARPTPQTKERRTALAKPESKAAKTQKRRLWPFGKKK